MLRRALLRDRDDRGFTMVELAVSMVITGIVATALFSMLHSGSNAEEDLQQIATSQQDIRVALVEVTKDVRATEPITHTSDDRIVVEHRELSGGAATTVEWRYDASAKELVREVDTPGGPAVTYRLEGVEPEAGEPVFAYRNAAGDLLDPADAPACAVTVEVNLRGTGVEGSEAHPVEVGTDVQLRNVAPSGAC